MRGKQAATLAAIFAVCSAVPSLGQSAASFNGSTGQIAFGNAAATPELGLAEFTIEFWFQRTGTGVTSTTGTGGFTGYPLVTKGRGEAEASNVDMNYFVGIRSSDNVLAADFEEAGSGPSPGLNHPVFGSTAIVNNVWYHAAITYDGSEWRIYLNGQLDGSAQIDREPRADSIQHFGVATAFSSTGAAQGRFQGLIDEIRVWDHARSHGEILGAINSEITSASGLVGRWGLNEGSGTNAADSSGNANDGTLTGSTWVAGAPFDLNLPPNQPTLVMPSNGAAGVGTSPTLAVTVTDPDTDDMDVTFYGRQVGGGPMQPFTVIALPDTQFYSCGSNCAQNGDPATFSAQTQWALDNLTGQDIAFVTQLGDCVQNGDNGGNPVEWLVASSAFAIIEDPITTQLVDGIPFGIAVGNHDQSPTGNADGTTTFYNQYFGEAHFAGRAYYGGHYGSNNDNHYQLFSGGGIDFIIVHLEYDTSPDAAVLTWANDLLQTHSDRKAIVVSHYFLNADGSFGVQGQATYDALKGNENLFLMLCGHIHDEARRSDVFNGNEVHTLLSDYQGRANGGDGWLRILTFNPQDNTIDVQTYSPTLDQFEVDASSQFTLTFSGGGFVPDFQEIGTVTDVASGANASVVWSSLRSLPANETFEWYVDVSDSTGTTPGPVWSFNTACSQDADCEDGNPCTVGSCDTSGFCQYTNTNGVCDDGNPCTDDACNSGTCGFTPNSASCDDGDACTESDVCSNGSCAGDAVVCGGGEICAPDTGVCVAPVTVTFQQGANGYTGAKDTFLQSSAPTANNSAATTLIVDLSPTQHVLMQFDDIFGEGAGQIPPGATILSADLTINVTNESVGVGASLYRMLQTWNDTDNWNTWGSGVQNNGLEAATTADASGSSGVGPFTLDVTSSLQAWASSPASNFGWAWLPPGVDNSWQFSSAEAATAANRPHLEVTYLSATCVDENDCDDGDLCTTDDCSDGFCEFVPVECPMGESCAPSSGECELLPTVGEVIIAAVQAWNNPGADNPGEFIELFNTTDRTIALDNMEIISRVDTNADGVLDTDWSLSADLTGKSIAPHSFFLIAESDVDAEGPGNGLHDVETDMDLATGEGGAAERAISVQLVIDGVHMDYVLYGRHDGSDTAAVPPGDIPFAGFSSTTLVPAGSVWSYLDDGSDQGTAWSQPGFDDSSWASGPAELGYGDGGEATVVNCGACACPCNPKHITTYFRRSFNVADPDAVGALTLRLVRDDGAVVYLNGIEVQRPNMPAGPITFTTMANVTVGGADESTFFEYSVDPSLLVAGTNLLAVEIHQDSTTSSDISFNLELLATAIRNEVCRNTRGTDSFVEGLLRRESAEDLYAGYDVEGFYTDEDALGDGFSNGVWTSPHDETNDAYEARNSTSAAVLPPGIECLDDLDCDDANDCTMDLCNTSGVCEYSNVAGACDDGDFCTEFDVCSSGVCVGSPIDCGSQSCRPSDGMCVDCLNDGECDDADACNGLETCDSNGVCQAGSSPDCDDGLDCTDDSCDSTNGCQNVDNCPFGEQCDAGSGMCELAPLLVAFNDMESEVGDQNAANVTTHDYLVTGGVLKDFDTGMDTPITVTGTIVGGYDANHPTNGGQANAETDAGETFGPAGSVIVDLQSSIELDDPSWQNILAIDNLDSTRRYTITVTSNRDNPLYDGARFTRVSLSGADTFTNASSPGVIVNSASSVSFSIGYNTVNGYVARWTNVSAADGSVSIVSEWDNGQGSGPNNTKGYAMTALKLEEFVECVDGADCDDGDLCTVDTCMGTACVFDPVDCSHLDDECVVGVCNPGSGMCETAPANEGGMCDDGDVCTSSDMCSNGVCVGDFEDCDSDGVCDTNDNCPTVPNAGQGDADTNGFGDACDGLFDFDHDGDVDLVDYGLVADCIGGPGVTTPPGGCGMAAFDAADADGDSDVDLRDAAELMLEFTGPLVSPCD